MSTTNIYTSITKKSPHPSSILSYNLLVFHIKVQYCEFPKVQTLTRKIVFFRKPTLIFISTWPNNHIKAFFKKNNKLIAHKAFDEKISP